MDTNNAIKINDNDNVVVAFVILLLAKKSSV